MRCTSNVISCCSAAGGTSNQSDFLILQWVGISGASPFQAVSNPYQMYLFWDSPSRTWQGTSYDNDFSGTKMNATLRCNAASFAAGVYTPEDWTLTLTNGAGTTVAFYKASNGGVTPVSRSYHGFSLFFLLPPGTPHAASTMLVVVPGCRAVTVPCCPRPLASVLALTLQGDGAPPTTSSYVLVWDDARQDWYGGYPSNSQAALFCAGGAFKLHYMGCGQSTLFTQTALDPQAGKITLRGGTTTATVFPAPWFAADGAPAVSPGTPSFRKAQNVVPARRVGARGGKPLYAWAAPPQRWVTPVQPDDNGYFRRYLGWYTSGFGAQKIGGQFCVHLPAAITWTATAGGFAGLPAGSSGTLTRDPPGVNCAVQSYSSPLPACGGSSGVMTLTYAQGASFGASGDTGDPDGIVVYDVMALDMQWAGSGSSPTHGRIYPCVGAPVSCDPLTMVFDVQLDPLPFGPCQFVGTIALSGSGP